ncbi:MAG: T9SS type A sorting domain-containing protein [Chitinophagales bacterium]|nr:T9SS type A sorting domain-containing protein [Chitinophagales bacterium]
MNNRVLFETLNSDTTQVEELELETFFDTTSQSGIGKLEDFTDALQSDSALQSAENIEDIGSINEQVPEYLYYEENEKMVNEIFLNTVAVGIDTLTDDQKEFIETMALSCPSVNGIAVFKARPFYTMIIDSLTYFNDSLCSAVSEQKRSEEKVRIINCYPNPTSKNTLVDLGDIAEQETEMVIYDFLGREQQRLQISAGIQFYQLQFDAKPPGIYCIQLLRNNVPFASCNLVLMQ